jgi:DNA-damage-inducible protein J
MRATTKKSIKDAVVNSRMEHATKEKAEKVLNKIGLSAADAVRLFFSQIILHNGLPFAVKIPNQQTIKAFEDIEEGKTHTAKSGRDILQD